MNFEPANTGTAIRSLLTWLLVLLVVANVVVWSAWPIRDQLVTLGILVPPPVQRVDLEPLALPLPVEPVDRSSETEQPFESDTDGEPGREQPDNAGPAALPVEAPSSPPGTQPIGLRTSANGRPPPPALLNCVIVGPVESQEALEAVATHLRSSDALVDSPQGSGAVALDYHVYVEPSASREAARLVVQELNAQQIRDVAIIPSGTYENAVALGLYRNRNLADARQAQIAALGYAVKVRERHWLRAREVPADALGDIDHGPCP